MCGRWRVQSKTPESGRTAGGGGGGGPDGGMKVRGTEAGQIDVTSHQKGSSLWFLQAIQIQIERQRRQGEFERRVLWSVKVIHPKSAGRTVVHVRF